MVMVGAPTSPPQVDLKRIQKASTPGSSPRFRTGAPFAFLSCKNVVLPSGTSGTSGGPVAPSPQLNGWISTAK